MSRITQMGVTAAVPAQYVDPLTPDELREQVRYLGAQQQPALRHYVGGIQPSGPLAIQ